MLGKMVCCAAPPNEEPAPLVGVGLCQLGVHRTSISGVIRGASRPARMVLAMSLESGQAGLHLQGVGVSACVLGA